MITVIVQYLNGTIREIRCSEDADLTYLADLEYRRSLNIADVRILGSDKEAMHG